MTCPDFTTTQDGNGIILRAHTTAAREWLRDQDAARDLDGLDLDVWNHQTWLGSGGPLLARRGRGARLPVHRRGRGAQGGVARSGSVERRGAFTGSVSFALPSGSA
jgi:hypothetical protein